MKKIRDAYAALAVGDLTGALKDLSPAGVFHFEGLGPFSGDRRGVADIKAGLVGIFSLTAGTQKLQIASIFADDRHGVVVLRERASRPDGATLDVDEVHLFAFDGDGRVTDLWDLPSDPDAHDAFFEGRDAPKDSGNGM